MNPLRPRILIAGGWFLLSLAIPFEFIRGLHNHKVLKGDEPWWYKTMELLLAYYVSCNLVFAWSSGVFNYDKYEIGDLDFLSSSTASVVAIVTLGIGVIIASVFNKHLPKFTRSSLIAGYYAFLIMKSFDEVAVHHKFFPSANTVWLLTVGLIILFEMRRLKLQNKFGDWPLSFFILLGMLAFFAKFYYPHIKSEWGGGSPIPVTVAFSKDAVPFAGQSLSCLLVDETDAGFYIVAKNERVATFVPRSAVASVRFSGESQSLLAK